MVVLFLNHGNAVGIANHGLQRVYDVGQQRCALMVNMTKRLPGEPDILDERVGSKGVECQLVLLQGVHEQPAMNDFGGSRSLDYLVNFLDEVGIQRIEFMGFAFLRFGGGFSLDAGRSLVNPFLPAREQCQLLVV